MVLNNKSKSDLYKIKVAARFTNKVALIGVD
jgi:hypothetical protein